MTQVLQLLSMLKEFSPSGLPNAIFVDYVNKHPSLGAVKVERPFLDDLLAALSQSDLRKLVLSWPFFYIRQADHIAAYERLRHLRVEHLQLTRPQDNSNELAHLNTDALTTLEALIYISESYYAAKTDIAALASFARRAGTLQTIDISLLASPTMEESTSTLTTNIPLLNVLLRIIANHSEPFRVLDYRLDRLGHRNLVKGRLYQEILPDDSVWQEWHITRIYLDCLAPGKGDWPSTRFLEELAETLPHLEHLTLKNLDYDKELTTVSFFCIQSLGY